MYEPTIYASRFTGIGAGWDAPRPSTVRVLRGDFISDGDHRSRVPRDPRGWPARPVLTGGTVTIRSENRLRRVPIRPVVDPLAATMGPWS